MQVGTGGFSKVGVSTKRPIAIHVADGTGGSSTPAIDTNARGNNLTVHILSQIMTHKL